MILHYISIIYVLVYEDWILEDLRICELIIIINDINVC